jgi:hypothetical protein
MDNWFGFETPEQKKARELEEKRKDPAYAQMLEQEAARDKSQRDSFEKQIQLLQAQAADTAGPEMTNNPLVTGPDGKIALRDEFKAKGQGDYIKQLLSKQQLDEQNAMDTTAQRGQQAQTQAFSSLGMRGGLNTANRANLTRQNMRDTLFAKQDIARQGMGQRMDLNTKGTEMDQKADSTNLSNLLTGAEKVNAFNLEKYKQQMSVKAADKQAAATRDAGNGEGSWVCTEVHKRSPLTAQEIGSLQVMKKFAKAEFPELAEFYLYDCSPLVSRMTDWDENTQVVKQTAALVKSDVRAAFEFYASKMFEAMNKFWPECSNPTYLNLKEIF